MAQFTSGTQMIQDRRVNHDPEPWVNWGNGNRMARAKDSELDEYAPRPEFDVRDNPILARFRAEEDGSKNAALGYLDLLDANVMRKAAGWHDHLGMLRYRFKADGWSADFGGEQIDHARRVLTKLAALRA